MMTTDLPTTEADAVVRHVGELGARLVAVARAGGAVSVGTPKIVHEGDWGNLHDLGLRRVVIEYRLPRRAA